MNKELTLASSLFMKTMDMEPSLLYLWKSRLENHAFNILIYSSLIIIIIIKNATTDLLMEMFKIEAIKVSISSQEASK